LVPGALIQGRFEIERVIGAGGMGVVFRAKDHLDGCHVAVKVLRDNDPTKVERFEREGKVLAEMHHPGIVRYVAHGVSPLGERYIVMEWLEGEDLSRRLARQALSPQESLTILHRAAAALAVAHAHGFVHRDIKPSNLFLVAGSVERVSVLDFGIARLLDDDAHPLTAAGVLIGTPGYMAPEQAKGLPVRDARTDVFSLGCVIFECLTGRRAFKGVNVMAVLAKIQLEDVPPVRKLVPELPESVERLVSRMMARDPEARLRDAAEVVAALDALPDFASSKLPLPEILPGDPTLSTGQLRRGALTMSEQRLVSVVLAGTWSAQGSAGARALAAIDVERYGGRFNVLANGAMLVTIWGSGSTVDRAVRACRCALSLRGRFPSVRVCVVTGRGVVSAQVVEGSVIDRGARILGAARAGAIQLDATTAEMLDSRFFIDTIASAFVLRGERSQYHASPLLLGKPTAFLGRSREIATLEAIFSGCAEERSASAVIITGEAGTGKSRLFQELLKRIRRRGEPVEVLVGRADSLGESAPLGILADAIRDAAGIRDGEPLDERRRKLTERFARCLSGAATARVSALLGELSGTPFPDDTAPELRAARGNAQIMGDAMRAAWEEWIAAECSAGPVVLGLEDLHWGDAASVRLIDATLRNLRDLPLLVLVLARPEIHTRFFALWAGRGAQEVKLGPLPRKASEQLVTEALGKRVGAEMVARVVDRGNGNPFYLEELVRAVAAGRHDTFPDSMLGMVEARLDAEGTEAKRILRAASVYGERFSMRGVAALLGGEEHVTEAREWLERLTARELVTAPAPSAREGDALYSFGHALVREAAYATLTESDRVLGHRLAGEWLEASGSTDAVALAEHFQRGGEPRRAVRWYGKGAEQALAADDLAAAIHRARCGIACGASGIERAALLLVKAEAYVWRGEIAIGEARALDASALFTLGSEGWFRALYQAVVAAGKLGHFESVEDCFTAVSQVVAEPAALSAQVSCLCACAANLMFGGLAASAAAFAALEPLAPTDALSIALIRQTRAFRAMAQGDTMACLEGLSLTLTSFEEAVDRRNACSTRVNLGFVLAEVGAFEPAEEALRAALASADRMGLHELVAVARQNLGHVLCCRGKLEEARSVQQQALEALHRQKSPRDEGLARIYLAEVELCAGDSIAAERESREALSLLPGIPARRAVALATLASALLAQGRRDEALREASEAYATLSALGSIEEGEAMIRLAYAEALAAAGEHAKARAAIVEARERLLARAACIRDPAWREPFLSRIPEHARTIALAAATEDPGGAVG
jgi:eukaryotic-like serine/threonine-protein kinase